MYVFVGLCPRVVLIIQLIVLYICFCRPMPQSCIYWRSVQTTREVAGLQPGRILHFLKTMKVRKHCVILNILNNTFKWFDFYLKYELKLTNVFYFWKIVLYSIIKNCDLPLTFYILILTKCLLLIILFIRNDFYLH